ncbi:MAG: GIY-YIG nuclease family protein [Trebonia sp.]
MAGGTPVLVHNCGKSHGVYIFDDLANPGKVYVGKTNNFARRLGVYVDNGRISDPFDAICIQICGTDDDLFRAEYIFKSGLEKMGVPLSNDIESPRKAIYYARQLIQRRLGGLNRSKQIRPVDSRIPEAAAPQTLRLAS